MNTDETITCTHNLAEKETAVGWDGLCPICLQAQRDTLLAALREIEAGAYPGMALTPGGPQYQTKKRMDRGMMRRIARAAISGVEGEK